VRLIGFRYLLRWRIVIFILILTLTSMLFSITAFSFLGFYNGFNVYLGEGEDIVAIYDARGRTPFTGLVPVYLAEHVGSLNGVLASSPEVIAPSVVKDRSIFLRGILPERFSKLNTLTMLEGDMLSLTDVNSAIIGRRFSERLSLNLGDKVLVNGVLAEKYLELQIKGIYESQSMMDDEALVPLYIGQWLRAADYSQVTVIRVKIDKGKVSATQLFEEIAKEASEPTQDGGQGEEPIEGIISNVKISFRPEDVGVDEAQKFMKGYLDRYGVTKETLVILSIMVLILASASVAIASRTFVQQHRRELEILKSLGASNKTIKTDLLVKVLFWSLASSALGIFLAVVMLRVFEGIDYLQVLSHRLFIQVDPLTIALNVTLIFALAAISITRSDVKQ